MSFKEIIKEMFADQGEIAITIIKLLSVVAVIGSIYELNWISLFVSSLALLLSFSPFFLRHQYQIVLPRFLQVFIIFFIFAGLVLGEVGSFYAEYRWWDSFLHLLSGMALGFIGFLIIYIFYKTEKFNASPILFAVLSFCFALALGALWEIIEFSIDGLLGLNTQTARNLCEYGLAACDSRLGLIDTMRDLILDSVGALCASIAAYLHLKKKSFAFFHELLKEFEEKNKHLFKRRRLWFSIRRRKR